jgi:predicted RNA binding protein YcfA (HicA-like mRNA interferase family)
MNVVEAMYLTLYGFIALTIAFLVGYIIDPRNRARLLRVITNRNYGVVAIRGKGGHTTYKMHDFNKVTFSHGKGEHAKVYVINEDYTDRSGTVPIAYYHVDDTNPATLLHSASKKIPPEAMNSIVLLIKALNEAKTSLTQNKMLILLIIILAISAITLLLVFLTLIKLGGVEAMTRYTASALNITQPAAQGFRLA